MRHLSWLAITLAVSAIAPITVTTLTIVQPAWAQTIRNDDVPGQMARARSQLEPIRQRIARAERAGQTQERAAALADMKRILDDLAPAVESMAGDVEKQRAVHAEFDAWQAEYAAANQARASDSGDFFLMMSERWRQLSPQVQAYADETEPATFEVLLKDPSVEGFGMPKTQAAARALDAYLVEIESHPQYPKNKNSPNVASDLAQARKARADAVARLADAAKAVVDQAAVQNLDQAGRDRVKKMLEHDIPYALAGSPRIEEVSARARGLLAKDNPSTRPEEGDTGGYGAHGYLVGIADKVWPIYAGRYPTSTGDPMTAGRGSLVLFRDARVIPADQMGRNDADLVLMVEGRPVVCTFDPVVKQHVANIQSETGMKTLPNVTVIGVVRGLGRVNLVRQPGSTPGTTNPAGTEGESSPQESQTLQPRDGVAIDVLAIRAGPIAIGVDPTPDQKQSVP